MLRSSPSLCYPKAARCRAPHLFRPNKPADSPAAVLSCDLLIATEVRTDELFSGAVVAQQGLIATNEVPELTTATLLPRGAPPQVSFAAHPRRADGEAYGELTLTVRGALNAGRVSIRPSSLSQNEGLDFEEGTTVSLLLPQITAGESALPLHVVDILTTATVTGTGGGYVTATTVFEEHSPIGVDFHLHNFSGRSPSVGFAYALAFLTAA